MTDTEVVLTIFGEPFILKSIAGCWDYWDWKKELEIKGFIVRLGCKFYSEGSEFLEKSNYPDSPVRWDVIIRNDHSSFVNSRWIVADTIVEAEDAIRIKLEESILLVQEDYDKRKRDYTDDLEEFLALPRISINSFSGEHM